MNYWKNVERCPVCHRMYSEDNKKTNHHILPRRHFDGIGRKFEICRKCHDHLERFILRQEKHQQLEEKEYFRILNKFIYRHTPAGYKILFVRYNENWRMA